MPIVALEITKRASFQGAQEFFSNVYTLDSGEVDINDDWSGVANRIAGFEKAIMDNWVTFDSYAVWNLEGTAIERVIVDQGGLSGTGTFAPSGVYRECAVLIRFEISRSPILRRRRWLKKWLHGVSLGDSTGIKDGSAVGTPAVLSAIQTNYITPLLAPIGGVGPFGNSVFCNSDGERPAAGTINQYMEHRQFHR